MHLSSFIIGWLLGAFVATSSPACRWSMKRTIEMKHPFYDLTQAAGILGCTSAQVRAACENGMMPNSVSVQKGTDWRVSRKDILRYRDCQEAFKEAFDIGGEDA